MKWSTQERAAVAAPWTKDTSHGIMHPRRGIEGISSQILPPDTISIPPGQDSTTPRECNAERLRISISHLAHGMTSVRSSDSLRMPVQSRVHSWVENGGCSNLSEYLSIPGEAAITPALPTLCNVAVATNLVYPALAVAADADS